MTVTTSSGCSWTASNGGASWITITSGGSGTGSGTVYYSITANTGTSGRSANMTIAGQNFSVAQSAGSTGGTAPVITTQPQNQTVQAGANNVTFTIVATGASLNYQWRKDGVNISGETVSTLTLNSVTAANSGGYSVVVSNPYGSVISTTASLAVLDDGANGNTPSQSVAPLCPAPPAGVSNLILITHGWEPLYNEGGESVYGDISWITNMANAIRAKVDPNTWEVRTLDWTDVSQIPDPDAVRELGWIGGVLYASQLSQQRQWNHIHLIAHSAGAAVIDGITWALKHSPNAPVIQETFLDPYTGSDLEGRSSYGQYADWADDYFVIDLLTDYGGVLLLQSPDSTSGQLKWAYNVDVGGALEAAIPVQFFAGSGVAGSTPSYVYTPSHGSPIDFYMSTINGTASSCAAGYGFPLSIEAGGSGMWATDSRNNSSLALCGTMSLSVNQPVRSDSPFDLSTVPTGTSSSGVNFVGNNGASLNSSAPSQPQVKSNGFHPLDETSSGPAWLATGVAVSNFVNFIQFDAVFTDTNSAQGLLTVYWNTNQIGVMDERVAQTNLQTYRFELPGTVSSGNYTLSLRLDSFTNSSSIIVTNVTTGFVGLMQPSTLGISVTNGAPMLQLTGPNNYTYLIQSSTNLVDWMPTALLLNTNGTAQYLDFPVTNSGTRFYRVVPWGANSTNGPVTNVVFSDNFTGNSIDTTKWTTSGNTVLQTNQTMEILTTVTDAGGSLTSVPFPVNSTGKITISRQVFVHYGYPDFEGEFTMTIGSLPFSVRYANMTYSGSGFQPCYGFILTRNNARPDVTSNQGDVGPAFTPLWDTWFTEKVTYDPTTGIMDYFTNNVSAGTYNVGALPQTNSPTATLFFSAWGWYTGHQQLMQNLVVSQTQ